MDICLVRADERRCRTVEKEHDYETQPLSTAG